LNESTSRGRIGPWAAVHGALDVADFPLAGFADQVVADDLVGRIGPRIALVSARREMIMADQRRVD